MYLKQVARGPEKRLRWVFDIPFTCSLDGRKKRYRRDAAVQTKVGAHAEYRRLMTRLETTGTLEAPTQLEFTFSDAINLWRSVAAPRLKHSTRVGYEQAFAGPLGELHSEPIRSISKAVVQRLDAKLIAAEFKTSSRANVQIALRSVLRCAVDSGELEAMPPLPPLPREGRRINRPMVLSDVERVLANCNEAQRLAFSLIAFAGLRPSEVRGLRWSDVDLAKREIVVRRGITKGVEVSPKSGHARRVPIPERLRDLLAATPRKNGPWGAVALNSKRQPWGEWGLVQAFRRACHERLWSPHTLRHFYVSQLFRAGANARAVQLLVGHSELTTTQRYADLNDADLAATVALLEPKSDNSPSTGPIGCGPEVNETAVSN